MEGWRKKNQSALELWICVISVKDGHEIGMPSGALERGLSNVY